MTDTRRALLALTGIKPMFAVTLKKPDGQEVVQNRRALSATHAVAECNRSIGAKNSAMAGMRVVGVQRV